MGDATDNNIAVVESLVGACIATGFHEKLKIPCFLKYEGNTLMESGRFVSPVCWTASDNYRKYGSDFDF